MPTKDFAAHHRRMNTFREFVAHNNWTIADEQELQYDAYQITVTDGINQNPVDFFPSGKMLVGGKPGSLRSALLAWRATHAITPGKETLPVAQSSLSGFQPPAALQDFRGLARIGLDEAGKGDYFGALVIGAVYADEHTETTLADLGVRDSKQLYDKRIQQLAETIKAMCPHEVVIIGPERYNELYQDMRNLNRLLAKGHAFSLERLLEKTPCDLAIADQFGNESYIREALMERGRQIKLVQRHHAEEDIAVAAASLLARAAFVQHFEQLSRRLGITLPKGASDPAIITAGREVVTKYGRDMLARVAKLHFKTTEVIVNNE